MTATKQERSVTIVIKGQHADELKARFEKMFEQENTLEWLEAAYQAAQPKESKPWDWKRALWWGLAAAAGTGLSYLCHKKAPMINHAACAVLGKGLGEQVGLKGRLSAIPGAGVTLASYWAHDNMPLVSIAMAAIGHAECVGTAGEFVSERFVEWKEEREAQVDTEEPLKEEGQHEEGQHEA